MTDSLLQRAQILLQTNRTAEAEKIVRQALGQDPNNGQALAMLALCCLNLDKHAEALEPARKAVAQAPDNHRFLYILGYAYFLNNYQKEARDTVNSALQIDPSDPDLYRLLAQIEMHESRWELALYNIEKGLEIDPEDEALLNLRTRALVKLNRTSEAGATVDYALFQNPQNSWSHANKGWVQVEKGEYEAASKSFLEALRLDPNNEHARSGLKEALKAKNPLYRVVLRYFLWMNKLSQQNQWIVIIGAYAGFRIVRYVSATNPELEPYLMPLIVAYIIFVYSSWIAVPIANAFLRLHPLGKHALDQDEITASNLTGLCLIAAGLCWGAGWYFDSELLVLNGIILGALLIPVGGLFSTPEGSSARKQLTWYAVILAIAGLGIHNAGALMGLEGMSGLGLGVFAIGIVAYGWVANWVIGRAVRRFGR